MATIWPYLASFGHNLPYLASFSLKYVNIGLIWPQIRQYWPHGLMSLASLPHGLMSLASLPHVLGLIASWPHGLTALASWPHGLTALASWPYPPIPMAIHPHTHAPPYPHTRVPYPMPYHYPAHCSSCPHPSWRTDAVHQASFRLKTRGYNDNLIAIFGNTGKSGISRLCSNRTLLK